MNVYMSRLDLDKNQPKTYTCFTAFRQQEISLFSSFTKSLSTAAGVSWHKDSSNMVKRLHYLEDTWLSALTLKENLDLTIWTIPDTYASSHPAIAVLFQTSVSFMTPAQPSYHYPKSSSYLFRHIQNLE